MVIVQFTSKEFSSYNLDMSDDDIGVKRHYRKGIYLIRLFPNAM